MLMCSVIIASLSRAYGVLLWEIASYGETPLNDYDAQEVVDMAQNSSLRHSQ